MDDADEGINPREIDFEWRHRDEELHEQPQCGPQQPKWILKGKAAIDSENSKHDVEDRLNPNEEEK